MLIAALAAIAALTAASAAAAAELEPRIPHPTGHHPVGTRAIAMTDRARPEGYGTAGPRRMMVQVSYPRAERKPCRPSRYLEPAVAQALIRAIAVKETVDVRTGMCRGGAMAAGKHPVLVFSHAFTAERNVYTTLTADLASRGYIVVAPDHWPDAFAEQFPGGDARTGLYGAPLTPVTVSAAELAQLVERRARDSSFVLTRILRMGAKRSGFLAGRVDRRRVGIFGHSLGGATAARELTRDRRFDAGVDLDGSLFGDWATSRHPRAPFMLLAAEGGLASIYPDDPICRYFDDARAPKYRFSLTDGLHFSYSDFQSLAPQVAALDPSWVFAGAYQVVIGTVDPGLAVRAERTALARFFGAEVKGTKRKVKPPTGLTRITAGCSVPG
jgi:dienelactone hydrolase